MKIYDQDSKKVLNSITLYLKPNEATNLCDGIKDLIDNPQSHHVHLNDDNSQNEITIAVYTKDNIDEFDEESKEILGEDL